MSLNSLKKTIMAILWFTGQLTTSTLLWRKKTQLVTPFPTGSSKSYTTKIDFPFKASQLNLEWTIKDLR